jgi:hypothetical protein
MGEYHVPSSKGAADAKRGERPEKETAMWQPFISLLEYV